VADPQESIEDGDQANNSGARSGPQPPRALTDGTGSSDAKSKSDAAPLATFYRQRTSEALGDSPAADEVEATLWRSPSFRFALLAASIVVAAVAGSFGGALIASEFMRRPAVEAAAAVPKAADTRDARDLVQTLKAQLAELAALKTSLDSANHSASSQLIKISDRLDALERAQTDPSGKLARIADAVDRLEKRSASTETTGAIAPSQPAAATSTPAVETNVTGPILNDWVVQDVHNGRALIESRYGAEFFVASGSVLPGLGKVEAVKRQNGQWVVVTTKGVITSGDKD
jgi:hypothetical protein